MKKMSKELLEKINGILLLDKPFDITSNGALQKIKHLFGAKKAGHTGSLDPLATGMLPICFGEATKICQFLLESDKYYYVTARLGVRTATGDAEGEVLSTQEVVGVTQELIETTLQHYQGTIEQVPPMYSAVKFNGKPLYKLARRGIEIERKPRTVQIHSLQLKSFGDDTFAILVHCSKGTYVRTLIEDIGQALGCGAHVSRLRRTAVSPYQDTRMYTLAELEEIRETRGLGKLRECMLPLDSSVQHFPALHLTTAATFYLRMGQPVMAPQIRSQGLIRIFSDNGEFMGIGEMLEDGRVTPRRLLGYSRKIAKAV
jgi:tRNA pseudouridine55 synthase